MCHTVINIGAEIHTNAIPMIILTGIRPPQVCSDYFCCPLYYLPSTVGHRAAVGAKNQSCSKQMTGQRLGFVGSLNPKTPEPRFLNADPNMHLMNPGQSGEALGRPSPEP